LSATDLRQAVTQALSGGGELMMTIAEQWEQQGLEKGMEKGRQEGEAKALLRRVQVKFGPPEPAVAARIAAADSAQVERWLERILTANRPDELFE
jgi:flagellar biosynthesis/type III secretory pathway protein FliH